MQHEEENIRKKLQGKNPDEGFKVPENYFDTFSTKVKEQVEKEQLTHKQSIWGRLARPVFAIPVALIVLMVLGYFVFAPSSKVTSTQVAEQPATIDDLTTQEISEYLTQEVDLIGVDGEIEKELVLLAYEPEQVTATEQTTTPAPILTDEDDDTLKLSDTEIEEYLLETADDYLIESL